MVAHVLEQIDTGQLRPRTHAVARRLAELAQRPNVLAAEILAAFDAGHAVGNQQLLEKLWAEIESLPPTEQDSLRTLIPLFRADELVDSHLAEYLIGWAQDEGVPPDAIKAAFLRSQCPLSTHCGH